MGGLNWGAGLQTLGQALQQYAMLKYQEQEKAKEEERQRVALDESRAYANRTLGYQQREAQRRQQEQQQWMMQRDEERFNRENPLAPVAFDPSVAGGMRLEHRPLGYDFNRELADLDAQKALAEERRAAAARAANGGGDAPHAGQYVTLTNGEKVWATSDDLLDYANMGLYVPPKMPVKKAKTEDVQLGIGRALGAGQSLGSNLPTVMSEAERLIQSGRFSDPEGNINFGAAADSALANQVPGAYYGELATPQTRHTGPLAFIGVGPEVPIAGAAPVTPFSDIPSMANWLVDETAAGRDPISGKLPVGKSKTLARQLGIPFEQLPHAIGALMKAKTATDLEGVLPAQSLLYRAWISHNAEK